MTFNTDFREGLQKLTIVNEIINLFLPCVILMVMTNLICRAVFDNCCCSSDEEVSVLPSDDVSEDAHLGKLALIFLLAYILFGMPAELIATIEDYRRLSGQEA